jgi:hypothetical protein
MLGHVVMQDGNPRWAEDQLGSGEAAFRRLALLPRSNVSCRPLEAPFAKVNLHGSLEQLLIEAARHADEGARRRPSRRPPTPDAERLDESSRPTVAPRAADTATAATSSPTSTQRPRPAAPPRAIPRPPNTPIGLAAFHPKAGERPAAQEKPVNPSKSSKTNLGQILALDPSFKAAARADRQGSVLESSGDFDAETSAAMVTMALRQIADATAELGLGRPAAWHVSFAASTWYVVQSREELVLTIGSANKNPISTLKKLAKSYGVVP